MQPKNKNKAVELKKHVSTIHCSNGLSLLQRKIANALLYHAYDDLLKREEHEISIRELCSLIGYASNDYKTIKSSLVELLSTVIEWNVIAEDSLTNEEEWNASSIIADASIKSGTCRYSYSHKMKQLLYMPSMYGRLNMAIQAKFKSSYGLALYENTIRYQNLPQTPWFDMLIFRKLMGVEIDKYLVFRDFKKRVLDKAIDEVNLYSPIVLTPIYKKDKRNVVAIRFDIRAQSSMAALTNAPQKSSLNIILQEEFSMTFKQIEKILQKYEDKYIEEKIELVKNSNAYKEGKIINLSKYLLAALEENYQAVKTSKDILLENKQKKRQEYADQKLQQHDKERQKKAYDLYIETSVQEFLSQLADKDFAELLSQFEDNLRSQENSFLWTWYCKDGLKSKLVSMEFRQFIKQQKPDIFADLLTYEDFIKSVDNDKTQSRLF